MTKRPASPLRLDVKEFRQAQDAAFLLPGIEIDIGHIWGRPLVPAQRGGPEETGRIAGERWSVGFAQDARSLGLAAGGSFSLCD
jgi:hypothetical protein